MYISEKIVPFSEVSRSTKNEEESRMIMMLGIHSKIVFSLFAASKLKKRIEKEKGTPLISKRMNS